MFENLSEMSIWWAKDKKMMPLALAGVVQLSGALSYTTKGCRFNHSWGLGGQPFDASLSPVNKHALGWGLTIKKRWCLWMLPRIKYLYQIVSTIKFFWNAKCIIWIRKYLCTNKSITAGLHPVFRRFSILICTYNI